MGYLWFNAVLEYFSTISAEILAGFVGYYAFKWFDTFFSEDTKAELTKRLKQQPAISWPTMVILMNDRVFRGKKPSLFNRPRLWRTSLVSFFWATFLFIVFYASSQSFRVDVKPPTSVKVDFLPVVFLFFLLNPITDYCSLIETRLILKWMDSVKRGTTKIMLAILDGVLTFVLVWLMFLLLIFLTVYWWGNSSEGAILQSIEKIWNGFKLRPDGAIYGIYIYTTFATSVWIWLYVLAETAFKLFPFFQKRFPIEEKPFESLGVVVGILVFISSVMGSLIYATVFGG